MSVPANLESVAIFGSTVRGDVDAFSDRDILLAGALVDNAFEAKLSAAGYSTSCYTWQQMDGLARDGSLFLQHLKQEGRILVDREGRLESLLTGYRPLREYGHRIHENLELFEMVGGAAEFESLHGWAFDVLAVGFRNHAILSLANVGRYVFSFSALVEETAEIHRLSAHEKRLLSDLRVRKRDYRTGCAVDSSNVQLKQTFALIERITGFRCLSEDRSIEEFISRQIKSASVAAHWYYPLRRLEGAFRAMENASAWLDARDIETIESIICRPSPYCGVGARSVGTLHELVNATFQACLHRQAASKPALRSS
ncbi:hypothetical protein GCM10007320_34960 [Pseudorhodoferax aquiterrae]|uniref:Polymerase nucleotidyl transferase domain-containing protein n=1 Tax=Pseudorhodoferax aquiterrae TaxID=747304 RepID=A0ABQ3G4N6_9BURK|nr:hypothetical protein [Pseudorhodoferax aquiterrae]GHC88102.1 hypothetical protein GCM10007320_34960 [Pseudorhodoferax aquiterrae]